MRVALIEDHSIVAVVLARSLGNLGYVVDTFGHYPEGLDWEPYVAAILDLYLNGNTLDEGLENIAKTPVPVIVLTGVATVSCGLSCALQGARAFYVKPVEIAELVAALERIRYDGFASDRSLDPCP